MNSITANELKTRGISAVEERKVAKEEVFISVRGKEKYVVISLEKHAGLREMELEKAVQEARADSQAGRVEREGIEDHLKRVTDAILAGISRKLQQTYQEITRKTRAGLLIRHP